MKTLNKIAILLVFNSLIWITPQKITAQVSVDFQVFYDNLSPYGNWVDNSDYGYVWIPNVSSEFIPYRTNGYWVSTTIGWTWVSSYSWGWAPFHYGRWLYDNYYGWEWIPGNEWSPGWVTWRRSEGYYGWAPVGPGTDISIAYSNGYRLPYNQWTFVRDRDFGRTNINNYYVKSSSNIRIVNSSTVINNFQTDNSSLVRYNAGPDRAEVQRRTSKTIAPVVLRERNNPGQNLGKGELQIYRPRVEKNNAIGQRTMPSKVVQRKDVKPVTQRNTNSQPQQPTKQQSQNNNQQVQQQRVQQQQQQQNNNQQAKQQQVQQQRNDQQAKQQQVQQKNNNQQAQQQRAQQPTAQPARQQQGQQQRSNQQTQPQRTQQQPQSGNQQDHQQQDRK